MNLGSPVRVRLSPEKHLNFSEAAARKGQPLSTYLREHLEAGDDSREQIGSLRREVAALRHMIEELAETALEGGGSSRTGMSDSDRAAMIEALLLLRHLCKPEQHNEVRADLRRFGITMWRAEVANG